MNKRRWLKCFPTRKFSITFRYSLRSCFKFTLLALYSVFTDKSYGFKLKGKHVSAKITFVFIISCHLTKCAHRRLVDWISNFNNLCVTCFYIFFDLMGEAVQTTNSLATLRVVVSIRNNFYQRPTPCKNTRANLKGSHKQKEMKLSSKNVTKW